MSICNSRDLKDKYNFAQMKCNFSLVFFTKMKDDIPFSSCFFGIAPMYTNGDYMTIDRL